jgi:anti-sigma factor RsiW
VNDCARWRGDIGSFVLDALEQPRRAAVRDHLSECAWCRDELEELAPVAALLTKADPAVVLAAAAEPVRARRRRWALAPAAAAAAIVAALAIAQLRPQTEAVRFDPAPPGVHAAASVTPRAWGMQVNLQTSGLPVGRVYHVWCETAHGADVSAGTFNALPGRSVRVVLSTALRYSEWTVLRVRAPDGRTVLLGHKT